MLLRCPEICSKLKIKLMKFTGRFDYGPQHIYIVTYIYTNTHKHTQTHTHTHLGELEGRGDERKTEKTYWEM